MVSPSRWKARSNLSTRPCSRFFPGTPRAGLMRKQAMTLASLLDSRFDLTAASPRYEVVFGGGVQGGSARCVESPIGLEGMFRVHEDSGMASLRQQKEAGSPITSSKSFRDPSSRASSPDPPSHSAGGMWTLQWKRTAVSERDCKAKQTSGVRCGDWRADATRPCKKPLTGARKRTRTSTVLPPPGPEPGASTNSAIRAKFRPSLCHGTLPRQAQRGCCGSRAMRWRQSILRFPMNSTCARNSS
jgi:hypothetical protein